MTIRPLRLIISAATVIVLLVGTFSIQLGFGTGIGKAEAKSLTNASLSPTLSVSSNLANRRYAAAGDRAYDLGSEDGRFPAMGFHTRGEMGGIWTPPIKLLDGIWFGINGQWIGPATSFTSGFGYAQMALPAIHGLKITRTDFAPDGRHAVEFGLTLTASNSAPFELNVDAHSELMGEYPWGFTTPNQLQFNLPDTATFNAQQLVFREVGNPPVANAALAAAVTWNKQNMADLTQQADNVTIRPTEQGTQYPAPVGSLPSIRFEGAGFPDYPWMFATDQEYTMYALLAAGQFTTAENGLRSLAAVSDIANNKSGKVVHETVSDGSVYYGLNDEKGDVDETAKFPTAVAMVWRWTGHSSFRDALYGFSVRNVQYLVNLAKSDDDLWADGSGNVESSVLGAEPVDVAVYTIRALLDVADMAASKHDATTEHWALNHAAAMERAFQGAWWLPNIPQYADSLTDPNNQPLMQRWWIGVTPMEAELYSGGVPQPGLAPAADALQALALRETSCYSGQYGMYVEGGPGCDPGSYQGKAQVAYTLNTGVRAVALGNYGLLGPNDQQRYTDALAQ